MLQPARTKFRKAHKGRIKGIAKSGTDLSFGQYGLKALEPERGTARQIEAARRALQRYHKRAGRVRHTVPGPVTGSAPPSSGSAYIPTFRCRRSRSKSAWARARARRNC